MAITKKVISSVAQKNEENELQSAWPITPNFADVVSSNGYTLQDFFNNYQNYMKNTTFVYFGPNQPTNKHIGLWFDTSGNTASANEE